MRTVGDFVPLLGPPVRTGEGPLVAQVGAAWSVTFPEDFVAIVGAYGDSAVAERLFLCGARSLRSYAALMGGVLEQSGPVPHRVLPAAGGALLWGNTIDGDQFFLVPRPDGRWTVSAFRRLDAEHWYDSDLEFGDWLHRALTGRVAADWLPRWTALPHRVEPED
ncbi:hypothetical protein ABTZ03_17660 [Kitasatospora sp. NPDC096077]|uniref:hypothetical protein n=1 Tax=Kitasatospora sp. NPDC096077 TaxID=3155544 RepID=UPI00332EE821